MKKKKPTTMLEKMVKEYIEYLEKKYPLTFSQNKDMADFIEMAWMAGISKGMEIINN